MKAAPEHRFEVCLAMTTPRLTSALVLSLVLAACSGHSQSPSGVTPSNNQSSAANDRITAIEKARADSMRKRYTAADVAFMSGMIHHHSQAILIAGWAPTHGASASLQALCERIVNGQNDEIATMQHWLKDRGETVPTVDPSQMMSMSNMDHMVMMPGMLTMDQLMELDKSRGKDFDRLFLTDMIHHHQGALSMVQTLLGTNGSVQDDQLFKFASDMNADQTIEIERMTKMLAAL
jgi:uncharacterized protein (DUF305 family)